MPVLSVEQIVAIIVLVGPVAYQVAGILGNAVASSVAAKMPKAQRAKVLDLANLVVRAVEASSAGLAGPDKKTKAVAVLTDINAGLGLKVPPQVVSALVEASVQGMKAGIKPPAL